MIKHLSPRSKKEIDEYFKDAIDDKKLLKLIEKGKLIKNKTFKLKHSISIDKNASFENCQFTYIYRIL